MPSRGVGHGLNGWRASKMIDIIKLKLGLARLAIEDLTRRNQQPAPSAHGKVMSPEYRRLMP